MKITKGRESAQLDYRSISAQIKEAEEFFGNEKLNAVALNLGDNPYADKDGLVEFICGVELLEDPIISAKLVELKSLLISITTVVTAYINKYAAAYGQEYKTDADLWAKALSHIPLMGPSKVDQQTYSRKMRGVEIAGDFINLVLDIASGEGNALNNFKSFLEKQGNSLRAGIEENHDFYKTITVGIAVEVGEIGSQIVYYPKIKLYRVNFDRETSKFSSSCASYEEVTIHFDYIYGVGIFDYESLNNPDIKADFDKFITGQQKAQIEDATTFFNEEFEPKQGFLQTKSTKM
jgi:hypothetical protein